MSKILLTVILITFLKLSASYSDPVQYVDDWDLTNQFYISELNNVSVKENSVLLKETEIFKLDNSRFDIYETDNQILIYNIDNKILYSINSSTKEVTETKLNYGTLKAIVKDCDEIKLWLTEKIPNKSLVFKWASANRPKEFRCSYFIFGGRSNLTINNQGQSVSYDKAIQNKDYNYEGDIGELAEIINNQEKCNFFNKIKFN
jgi:hypothetical protein